MIRTLRRVSESLVLGSLLSFLATSCGQEAPEQGLPANAAAATESPVPDPLMVRPVDRLTAKIDILDRVVLAGSRHPLARAEFESGPVASDFRMERMMLVLRPDSVQEQALQKLMGIDWSDGHRSLDASFKECVLDYCSFVRIDLRKCAFKDCRMLEVNFSEANLTEDNFSG